MSRSHQRTSGDMAPGDEMAPWTDLPLVGRAAETALLTALRKGALAGQGGGSILLEGPAGVGKTRLLDHAAAEGSGAGMTVLRATGVESEVRLAHSGLHQLLFGLRQHFGELPEGQRQILNRLLGFLPGPAPDRFAVSVAVLGLLDRVLADGPVMLVIDDIQWIDDATSRTLDFVLHRLGTSPLGLVAALRAGWTCPLDRRDVVTRPIRPLEDRSAGLLLDQVHPGIAPDVRAQLLAEAAGNPLVLIELPALLSAEQLTGHAPPPSSLPLNERLESLFLPRVHELPEETRRLLLLAALEGTGSVRTVWAATAGGWPAADAALATAEHSGLMSLDTDRGQLVFRHPLVRSAIASSSTPEQRRVAHRALANALHHEPERRLGHLLASAVGPDEALSAAVEQAAHAALKRGNAAAALAGLTRAADLSCDDESLHRRLAQAAYAAVQAGRLDMTDDLVDQGYWEHASPEDAARAAPAVAMRHLESNGDSGAAHRALVQALRGLSAGRGAGPGEETLRISGFADGLGDELVFMLILVSFYAQRDDLWAEVEPWASTASRHVRLCYDALDSPGPLARGLHDRVRGAFEAFPRDAGPWPPTLMGWVALYFDDTAPYREKWRLSLELARDSGTFTQLSYCLILLSQDAYWAGRWDEAEALAREGMGLAKQFGYRLAGHRLGGLLATVEAARGRSDATRGLTDEIMEWAGPRRIGLLQVSVRQALCLLALGEGDFEQAYEHAVHVSPPGTFPALSPRSLWTVFDLAEAARRTGRAAQARAHVAAADKFGVGELSPRAALLLHGASALVASDDRAEESFRAALAVPDADRWPFDLARVQLCYGEWLLHRADHETATKLLGRAEATFEALGAQRWARRAHAALSPADVSPAAQPGQNPFGLTEQELQVAELAAGGLSNKEIASRLFLSHRTVSTHLYHVFPKLGVRSRAALRDALNSRRPGSPSRDSSA
ncbi:AAA family ATPase [Streptomyces shenzhenensis]|uniref:AAA family ATPase n=1 Tax=Streptomyces shenzhenensis TaxID=943815 RepID=UPI0033D15D7A